MGLAEVPYSNCPVSTLQLASGLFQFQLPELSARSLYVVPGVRWQGEADAVDVMRGEEVQVLGWLSMNRHLTRPQTLCLPGTHAKWVVVNQNEIRSVETALTGELFALLSSKSVLVKGPQVESEAEFVAGVNAAANKPDLLRQLFKTRARVVAAERDPRFAASYLSGLLIGSELGGRSNTADDLHIIASDKLSRWYLVAAKNLGIEAQIWSGPDMVVLGLKEIWCCRDA